MNQQFVANTFLFRLFSNRFGFFGQDDDHLYSIFMIHIYASQNIQLLVLQ